MNYYLRIIKNRKVRKFVNLIMTRFFGLFYKKEYLIGKHFEDSYIGWIWAYRNLTSRLFGENRNIPWPMSKYSTISTFQNIEFHQNSINCFQQKGCYFQNFAAKIFIGNNVWIAPNVGLITSNHNPYNLTQHMEGKDIIINDDCWIGMNSVILPGVELAKGTIVGAGSVVTTSFIEGNCLIAGTPAKLIKIYNNITN